LVGIRDSPTTLPMDLIRRYFTVHATMTDEFTNRDLRSVFQTFTDNFTDGCKPSVCHTITDGLKSIGIFQAGNFFLIFPTDIATEYGFTDERKADGRIPSVMTSVN